MQISLTFTVQDAYVSRLINAYCESYGYTGFLDDGVTTETKRDFFIRNAKSRIINDIINSTKAKEATLAADIAKKGAEALVDQEIVIS